MAWKNKSKKCYAYWVSIVTEPLVYSICLKGFPGANQALENLQRTTGLTRHIRLASTHPDSPEIAFVGELVRTLQPRVVLFGGWSPVYQTLMQTAEHSTTRFGVYWTSSGGQTDMSQETVKLAALLESPGIAFLALSSRGMASALHHAGIRAFYLPPTLVQLTEPSPVSGSESLLVSLFCPPAEYRRKNILNALLALSQVVGDFSLALNGLSHDPAYAVILARLNLRFQEWGWMAREAYEEKLWQIGLGVQLSFAESFNYVAAEHLLRGIPILASPMVPVMDLLDDATRTQLVVTRADDVESIRERIQTLLHASLLRAELGARARLALRAANTENIAAARQMLLEWQTQ